MQSLILEAWNNRELLKESKYSDAVKAVIEEVDKGRLRVAEPTEKGWVVRSVASSTKRAHEYVIAGPSTIR